MRKGCAEGQHKQLPCDRPVGVLVEGGRTGQSWKQEGGGLCNLLSSPQQLSSRLG